MGILNEKDIYSPKYVTAEITDSENRIHFVPIKHTIGDYFLCEIDSKLYVFTLKNARYLRYRQTLSRSFQVVQFDTTHYSSVSHHAKELELILTKNGLPKVDRMLFNVLRVLGRREKDPYKPMSIPDLVALFVEQGGHQFEQEVRNIKEYLDELDIDHIVTPVRKVTDWLQEDFLATNPSYLGEAVAHYQRMDTEHKRISNYEIKPTKNLTKYMLIGMAVAIIIAVGFIGYDQGWFKFATDLAGNVSTIQEGFKGLPAPGVPASAGVGRGECSDAYLQQNYTPEGLKVAIQNGQVDYNCMSDNMKNLVGDVDVPKVVAVP